MIKFINGSNLVWVSGETKSKWLFKDFESAETETNKMQVEFLNLIIM